MIRRQKSVFAALVYMATMFLCAHERIDTNFPGGMVILLIGAGATAMFVHVSHTD